MWERGRVGEPGGSDVTVTILAAEIGTLSLVHDTGSSSHSAGNPEERR